mmetsp:Transcript_34088/g.68221  ORF Transcript_34088/g.68221 Transcript_34088/m.68221 type:complete len:116 (+) Transcript_34088:147-494(+)
MASMGELQIAEFAADAIEGKLEEICETAVALGREDLKEDVCMLKFTKAGFRQMTVWERQKILRLARDFCFEHKTDNHGDEDAPSARTHRWRSLLGGVQERRPHQRSPPVDGSLPR